jgi:hypothetical protein
LCLLRPFKVHQRAIGRKSQVNLRLLCRGQKRRRADCPLRAECGKVFRPGLVTVDQNVAHQRVQTKKVDYSGAIALA